LLTDFHRKWTDAQQRQTRVTFCEIKLLFFDPNAIVSADACLGGETIFGSGAVPFAKCIIGELRL